jgi:hypothetical protein
VLEIGYFPIHPPPGEINQFPPVDGISDVRIHADGTPDT